MPVGECLGRMSAWGRGSLDPFLDENGELTLTSEEAINNRGLLKKIRQRKTVRTTPNGEKIEETQTEIEIHDAKDAVDKMLQIHGRYKTKIDISTLSEEEVDALLNKILNKVGNAA